MDNRIDKIPPLTGSAGAKTEQLRTQVNRIVDEVQRLLAGKDREIERLRKELEYERKK